MKVGKDPTASCCRDDFKLNKPATNQRSGNNRGRRHAPLPKSSEPCILVRLCKRRFSKVAGDPDNIVRRHVGRFQDATNVGPNEHQLLFADSGEGGQCLRFKADSITVIADTWSRRRFEGSQVSVFSSSPGLGL